MRVLYITNMYPTNTKAYYGIHVKEQIDFFIKSFKPDSRLYFINSADKGKLAYIKSVFDLFFFLKKNRFDVIHIHYGLAGLFLLFFKPHSKIYLTLHGSDILKEQGHYIQVALTKFILRRVHKAFVQNAEMGQVLHQINVRYEVLPCGIDSSFFDSSNTFKNSKGPKMIVFPSDPNRVEKNFPLFLSVLEILKNKLNVDLRYTCINGLSREEVRAVLNSADCLLMTSLSEGSPQIIKEALACNLPVVSVPVGDAEIVLKDLPFCFASSAYNPLELAYLVNASFSSSGMDIRVGFLKKEIYDNESVCKRLANNYFQ